MKKIFGREQITVFLAFALVVGIFSGCGAKKIKPEKLSENVNSEPEIITTEVDTEGLDKEDSDKGGSDKAGADSEEAGDVLGASRDAGTDEAGADPDKDQGAETVSEDSFDEEVPKAAEPEEKKKATSISDEEMDGLIEVLIADINCDPADVRCCALDDYDKDGSNEGFIYVGAGPDEDFGWCEGTIYYVTREKSEMVFGGAFAEMDGNVFKILDAVDRKFILFDEAFVTALVTHAYYVEGGQLKESNISRFGDINSDTDLTNMKMTFSTYDGFCTYEKGEESSAEWTGHTWKPYYFYYDSEKKDFMEYGGTEITATELKDIVGFDLASEIEAEGYQVDNILKRGNGIVNVNYSKEETLEDGTIDVTYKNVTYDENEGVFVDVWGTGTNTWQDSDFGGIYMNALNPEMAVY